MGLIRKGLFLGTMGAVSPNSRKQRVAMQTLATLQGKDERTVARTGTRRGAISGAAPPPTLRPVSRRPMTAYEAINTRGLTRRQAKELRAEYLAARTEEEQVAVMRKARAIRTKSAES